MSVTRIQDYQIHSVQLNSIRDEIAAARGDKPSLAERLATLPTGGGSVSLNQITKLNITASQTTPYIVDVPIPETQDFKRLPVEVLKFTPGEQNKIVTICEFDNADATSFQGTATDPQIVFDGTMYLKTLYQENMIDEGALGSGKLWTKVIDKTQFKSIEKVVVI